MIRGPISRGGAQIGLGEVDRRIRLSVADRPGVLEVGLRQLVRIRTLRERRADGVAVGDQGRLVTADTGAGQVLDVVGLGVGDRPGSGRATSAMAPAAAAAVNKPLIIVMSLVIGVTAAAEVTTL